VPFGWGITVTREIFEVIHGHVQTCLHSTCSSSFARGHQRCGLSSNYIELLSKFCISTTKHVSRCAELVDVIFLFHLKFLVAAYLSLVDLLDCKLVHQRRQCCLTYEQTEVNRLPLLLSVLPVSSILLIKSLNVLRFHCLE